MCGRLQGGKGTLFPLPHPWVAPESLILNRVKQTAPTKTKYLRTNHSPFVTKELSKTIIPRSKLQNQYLKHKSEEARAHFKIQGNLWVTLLRKARHDYYKSEKKFDSKKFGNTIKPIFGNKVTTRNNITLIQYKK